MEPFSWPEKLAKAIEDAVIADEPATIKVSTNARKQLGESARARMAPGNDKITFVISTDEDAI